MFNSRVKTICFTFFRLLLVGCQNNFFILVDEGAILDAVFEQFSYPPPTGFERIMIEKSVL